MIIVPGSINLDLIAKSNGLPAPGQTLSGTHFETAPGGKGANQALAARRAGGDVLMVGAVGSDANAAEAISMLKDADVNLDAVRKIELEEVPTGVALILVDSVSGENQIVVVPGANGHVHADDLSGLALNDTDFVVLQLEVPSNVVEAALTIAKKNGAKSLLNIAPFDSSAVGLARKANITIANETEFDELAVAMNLQGNDRIEKAKEFCRQTGNIIVVTLGGDGAFAIEGNAIYRANSLPIEPVDTVGAGDTFCGCLAVALGEGKSMEEALAFASAAGSLACLKNGAQPSIPYRAEIDDALNS
ncbi:MAG: ribokinase [Pseudomonadota bacterium]